jgi:enoyl-CoA hydratase
MPPDAAGAPPVLARVEGPLGRITLNRPEALNALTLEMVRAMDAALAAWAQDRGVAAVVVDGVGGRAFCAGGDIRAVWALGSAGALGLPPEEDFFQQEYTLNRRIHHYPKPYVALVDGIAMGGGLGISVHGSHRVATERTVMAMPECAIGVFPDVGGTWFLPRLADGIGWHMALTAARLSAGDALHAGLATHVVASADLAPLVEALAQAVGHGDAGRAVDAVLARHAAPPGPAPLSAQAPGLARVYAGAPDPATVIARLKAEGGAPWAEAGLAAIAGMSPTSLVVTAAALTRGAAMAYDDCARMEYGLMRAFLAGHDLFEGIRAAVVDKDRRPRWRPARLEDLAPDVPARYFAAPDRALAD